MAVKKWSPKDPQDIRDYWIDFTSLLAVNEIISSATIAVGDDETDPDVDDSDNTDSLVRVRFSGGAVGKHTVQYHIVTDLGQEFDLTKTLEIKERTG